MTEIPEDVMKAAQAAHAQFADSRVSMNLGEIIARAILAEREAQRERDAVTAESFKSMQCEIAGEIAAAIRKA